PLILPDQPVTPAAPRAARPVMRGMSKSSSRQWTGCAITCILRREIRQFDQIELSRYVRQRLPSCRVPREHKESDETLFHAAVRTPDNIRAVPTRNRPDAGLQIDRGSRHPIGLLR